MTPSSFSPPVARPAPARIRRAALLACVLFLPALPAAADDPQTARRDQTLQSVEPWWTHDFTLPADLALDAALRRDVEALAAEHRARVAASMATWVSEEDALLTDPSHRARLATPLLARYLNETALWQLDTTGDAFDAVTLRSLRDPGFCPAVSGRGPFVAMVAALQRMPADDRAVALASQRTLLARWGARRSPPPRPVPALEEVALNALPALAGPDRPANEPPVPPVVAWSQLRDPPRVPGPEVDCSLMQWALRRVPQANASVAEQVVLARYGQVIKGQTTWSRSDEPEFDDAGIPNLAKRLGISADITVQGHTRAVGTGFDELHIIARMVRVPGIRGVRAVAFETVFDRATLQRAGRFQLIDEQRNMDATQTYNWTIE